MKGITLVKRASLAFVAVVVGVVTLVPAGASASSGGHCSVAVDHTSSAVGEGAKVDAVITLYGRALEAFVKACSDRHFDVSAYSISSKGAGDNPAVTAEFASSKDALARRAERLRLVSWMRNLGIDSAGSTDVLSTLSTISVALQSDPPKWEQHVLLLSDGVQTTNYNFLLAKRPTKAFFDTLLGRVRADGAIYKFPPLTKVTFAGFNSSVQPNLTQTENGKFGDLMRTFWVAYFAAAGVSSVPDFKPSVQAPRV